MSVSLYRKYRPQKFSDVTGQKPAVSVLTNSLERGKVGHAYLFSGSRGCGKTSVARIFAKALNCTNREGYEPCGECGNCREITAGESLDVIEIDGASNNGVDNIRGLKENVTLSPFSSRYKIYIIDEVHMLSQGAFNALLKTLEEPPGHVIFIMATTEPQKVPVTIRSRCQHIPFHSITPEDIYSRLNYVCQNEGITAEPEALREISRQSDGALRDALSLLEQAAAAGDITLSNVEAVFGAGSRSSFEKWLATLRENQQEAYILLKSMFEAGASSVRVFEEIFSLVRDLWLVSRWKNIAETLGTSEQDRKFLVDESARWKTEDLRFILHTVLTALTDARLGVRTDILLGMFMLRLEGEPVARQVSAPVATAVATAPIATAPVVPTVPVATATVDDPALREELMSMSKSRNFLIYCALYDARTFTRGNDLVIDVGHVYTYEVMTVDKRAFEAAQIFCNWHNVVIKFGGTECVCPKLEGTKPDTKPEIPLFQPQKPGEIPQVQGSQPAHNPPKQEASTFKKIVDSLKLYMMNPEVIMMIQNEAAENEDEEIPEEGENE